MSPSPPPSSRGPRRPPRPAGASSSSPAKKAAAKQAPTKNAAAKQAPARKQAPAKKAAAPAPARAGGRRPIPAAPGPRPDRPARRRSAPRPAGPITSSVRFRDLPTGEVEAIARDQAAAKADATATAAKAKAKAAAGKRRPDPNELLPATPSPATAFRQRYGVVYNTHGPRMRLGVLWAVGVALSLAFEPMRPYGLATVYAVCAGIAAMQVVDAWQDVRGGADRWVAAFGASSLPVLATGGTGFLGGGLILLVGVAVAAALLRPAEQRTMSAVNAAGHTVFAAGCCGGAAASLVLLANYEIGAVIILVIYLMVYDASDYIVGSGASNGVEGPVAGALFIAATTMMMAVIEVPPFRGVDIWNFAMLAAVACPAGQLLASAMLPRANANAPALRRLDSLLVVAPAWAGLIGLYLQRAG